MADEWSDALGDALVDLMKRIARKGRRGFGRAAEAGRVALETRQKQKDLEHFWARQGKTAHHLVEAGEIDHPALRKAMDRIQVLEEELAERGLAPESEAE